jgi:hypothetical protein
MPDVAPDHRAAHHDRMVGIAATMPMFCDEFTVTPSARRACRHSRGGWALPTVSMSERMVVMVTMKAFWI